jgi:hypothetical protein
MAKDKKGKKPKEIVSPEHYVSAADAKPVVPRDEGARAAEQVHEDHGPGVRERQAHGDSRGDTTKDANTVGVVVSPGTPPGDFTRAGTAIDSDGLIGQPAERNAEHPGTEALDTSGEPLQPAPALPAPSAMAVEMANARAGAQRLLSTVVPDGVPGPVDPYAGFRGESKVHRQSDGTFDAIPGGAEVAPGSEVRTFDPSSVGALRGKPVPPQPNTQGPMGASSVVGPSMRNVSADEIGRAQS